MTIEYVPGLAGVPATKSAISHINGYKGELYYRGYTVEELVDKSTFEETALLLLEGELPTRDSLEIFCNELKRHRTIKINLEKTMHYLPTTSDPMQVLQVGVAMLSSFFPETQVHLRDKFSKQQQFNAAVTILSHVATLAAIWEHLRHGYRPIAANTEMSYAENFLYMIHGKAPDAKMVKLLDTCLILHAEHTINASTFTSMVTASTLANPCSVISAAIGSLSGPLHGGANTAVVKMIDEIGDPNQVEGYIDSRLKNKEIIWGMGHREYKTKDPRAKILEKMMTDLLGSEGKSSKALEIAKRVEQVCEDRLGEKGVYPNVDFYSGILYQEMGMRPALYTPIFAIARTSGWLAHFMEQLEQNRIFRPTQIYVGSEPREYQLVANR